MKKPEKTQKNPKKPEKARKNPKKPTGLGFFKKTRVFSNPILSRPAWLLLFTCTCTYMLNIYD